MYQSGFLTVLTVWMTGERGDVSSGMSEPLCPCVGDVMGSGTAKKNRMKHREWEKMPGRMDVRYEVG